MSTAGIDVLLYAHDGRGLGHVSRSIAIGLAIRRLAPELKVVLVTGSEYVPILAGLGHLEWIKLPGYRNVVSNGVAYGVNGASQLSYEEVKAIRIAILRTLFSELRPRVVVVDHYPGGKEGELLPILAHHVSLGSSWYLGIRSYPGIGSTIWNASTSALINKRYTGVLWYGDSNIACSDIYSDLIKQFSRVRVIETGYVSRAKELAAFCDFSINDSWPGVAAFTWCSNKSDSVIHSLSKVLPTLEGQAVPWWVAVGAGGDGHLHGEAVGALLESGLCDVFPPDTTFLPNLLNCQIAVICGGYNSLTDIMWSKVPSVVIVRHTADLEQERHATSLAASLSDRICFMSEEAACDPDILGKAIRQQMLFRQDASSTIPINGAETAAHVLLQTLS